MNRRLSGCAAALVALLLVAGTAPARAEQFSVDVNTFTYSYGSTVHALDFAVAGDFPPGTIDPASGLLISWSGDPPGATSWANGAWHMSMAQSTPTTPAARALSAIGGYFTGPLGAPPTDWEVTASFSHIANADTVGTDYKVKVGAGSYDPGAPNVSLDTRWFTGEYGGTQYDHVLFLDSSVEVGSHLWESENLVIQASDANPMDTSMQVKVVVTGGGQIFSSYYRLDGVADWTLAHTHTLPVGAGVLAGLPSSHPFVGIYNDAAAVPEPGSSWLLSGGLLVLLGVVALRRRGS